MGWSFISVTVIFLQTLTVRLTLFKGLVEDIESSFEIVTIVTFLTLTLMTMTSEQVIKTEIMMTMILIPSQIQPSPILHSPPPTPVQIQINQIYSPIHRIYLIGKHCDCDQFAF